MCGPKEIREMVNFKKTICVDFDGVIHRYSLGWKGGKVYDPPIEGSRENMKQLVDEGYEVIILTARLQPKYPDIKEQKAKMVEWLTKNGFILGSHYHGITNNKPSAVAYIDDKSIRFQDNWDKIRKYLL